MQREKKFNAAYFSKGLYSDYERESRRVMKTLAGRVARAGGLQKGARVLDAGCGKGFLVHFLRKDRGIEAWGIDISPYAVRNAVKDVRRYVRRGDIRRIPFRKNYFDAVVSFEVIYYLENKGLVKAIKELVRVTSDYIFLSSIYKHSWQASQKHNPDPLRPKKLLAKKEIIGLVEKSGARFIKKFYAESGGDILAFRKRHRR